MKIDKILDGKNLKIMLEGRLDTVTAPELEAVINEMADSAESLLIDFEKLDYISSAGLRVLLAAQKKMVNKGGMKLIHVNEIVQEVFDVTGFSDILEIE